MLTGQLGTVVVHIALGAEVSLLSDAVKLGELRWYFGAVLAVWGFGNELLMRVNREIHQVHWEDLVVFVHDVLVLVQLDVLLLVVEINRLEAFGKRHDLVHELLDRAAVRFAHCDLVRYETELVLCTEGSAPRAHLVVAHCEYHSVLFNLVTL